MGYAKVFKAADKIVLATASSYHVQIAEVAGVNGLASTAGSNKTIAGAAATSAIDGGVFGVIVQTAANAAAEP